MKTGDPSCKDHYNTIMSGYRCSLTSGNTDLATHTNVEHATRKTDPVVTVAGVVRIVCRGVECVIRGGEAPGRDVRYLEASPVPEHHRSAHVGEVELQGRVLVQADGQGPGVTAGQSAALLPAPVAKPGLLPHGDHPPLVLDVSLASHHSSAPADSPIEPFKIALTLHPFIIIMFTNLGSIRTVLDCWSYHTHPPPLAF